MRLIPLTVGLLYIMSSTAFNVIDSSEMGFTNGEIRG